MTRTGKLALIGAGGILAAVAACCVVLALAAALGVGRATPTAPLVAAATAAATATPTLRPTAAGGPPTPATPTLAPSPVVVAGCGGSVVIGRDAQLRADLDQWNRIVDAANAITRSWNALFDTTRGVPFAQAAGDAGLVAAADAYLAAAQAQLPALRAEVGAGRFAPLAARRVALTEAEVAYVTLLRQAAAESDGEVWDRAVDALPAVEEADGALKAEAERQCDFWRSRR